MKRQMARPSRSVTYQARRVLLAPRVWTGLEAAFLAVGIVLILAVVCVFLWTGPA